VKNVKLNLLEDIDDVKKSGDAIMAYGYHTKSGKKILQLIICCPQCGKTSASAGNHIYNRKTQTYHPSIVHNVELGGCGWHGWLRNGVFISC